ncbi:MAG: hypothetical protein JXR03_05505 [Cyclobacteriaceae bacterium]
MNESELALKSCELVGKDFEIEISEDTSFEKLFSELNRVVKYKLDHDFSGLINVLYRIDIQENKLKEILERSNPTQISSLLTQAIIERQKQKVISRAKYG